MRITKGVSFALIVAVLALSGCNAYAGRPAPTVPDSLADAADAASLRVLHVFRGGANDGAFPSGPIEVAGTFYGTTAGGGTYGKGTIYSIDSAGKEQVVHNFGGSGDGAFPEAGLLYSGGRFYGTTSKGGMKGAGIVFAMQPQGEYHVLHIFKGTDGRTPYGRLIAESGALYGTTVYGGTHCGTLGCGTVFRITPDGSEQVVYSFRDGKDGARPYSDLVFINGAFYGTTDGGGGCSSGGCGTIFAVDASGKERLLHTFNKSGDGKFPRCRLVFAEGALFGTAPGGGAHNNGMAFKIRLDGTAYTMLYSPKFNQGWQPIAGFVEIENSLYGTAYTGYSRTSHGTIFELGFSGRARLAYRFRGGAQGSHPNGELLAKDAMLFGATLSGGVCRDNSGGCGVVYAFSP